jgi:hypothetical protein
MSERLRKRDALSLAAAAAVECARARGATIHTSRPQNPPGEFEVVGGFITRLSDNVVMAEQPDDSVREL